MSLWSSELYTSWNNTSIKYQKNLLCIVIQLNGHKHHHYNKLSYKFTSCVIWNWSGYILVKITFTAYCKFSVQFCAPCLAFCSRLIFELLAIINITQKIAESGVFVVILWTFVLQEYWPLYTNHVIKDYMHPMEDITVYRPFTTNIWILNLLYSKLPVAYCWIQTPVEARFSRPIHTGPKAHPSICPMGTRSLGK